MYPFVRQLRGWVPPGRAPDHWTATARLRLRQQSRSIQLVLVLTAALWLCSGLRLLRDDGDGPAAASSFDTGEVDAWITSVLPNEPPTPLFITPSNASALEDDGSVRYRMRGINYQIKSRTTRLQRLPLLGAHYSPGANATYGYRFPSNPALVPHPISRRLDSPGTAHYLLAIQLGSGSLTRVQGRRSSYSEDGLQWATRHVLVNMTLRDLGDSFALLIDGDIPWPGPTAGIDMRLAESSDFDGGRTRDGSLLAWNKISQGVRTVFNSDALTNDLSRTIFDVRDPFQASRDQKNWIPIPSEGSNDSIKWIAHFTPFVVFDCGRLPSGTGEGRASCRLHTPAIDIDDTAGAEEYAQAQTAVFPPGKQQWRGSSPLLTLPKARHYAIGTVHERGYYRGTTYVDAYRHRFVVVDTLKFALVGWTDEFALLSDINSVDWFEFISGLSIFEDRELLLSFGYNDQEPWLAVLPLAQSLRFLRAASPEQEPSIRYIQSQYAL